MTRFELGLAAIERVRPVRFKYNGLGGTGDGHEYVGVIAQDIEKISPSMVTSKKAKLHDGDAQETEIKQVDPSAFTYMLINAVQEQQRIIQRQDARIAALERARAPLMSSLFSDGLGVGAALGLAGLGLFAAIRGQQKRAS